MSDASKVFKLRQETLSPSFKGGVVTAIESDLYLKDYKFLEEPISTMPIVIYFRKNSHLVQVFNKVLDKFESSGLISYWTNLHMNYKIIKESSSYGPKPMNFKAMLGAFQIILSGWVISLTLFLLEFVKVKISSVY